jgi:hypothetical protein
MGGRLTSRASHWLAGASRCEQAARKARSGLRIEHEKRAGMIRLLRIRFMANRFDVVPIWTNDESCVVVRVVLRTQTRRAIVFAARLKSRTVEIFNLPTILGREGQVEMRRLFLDSADAQRGLAVRAAKLDA